MKKKQLINYLHRAAFALPFCVSSNIYIAAAALWCKKARCAAANLTQKKPYRGGYISGSKTKRTLISALRGLFPSLKLTKKFSANIFGQSFSMSFFKARATITPQFEVKKAKKKSLFVIEQALVKSLVLLGFMRI